MSPTETSDDLHWADWLVFSLFIVITTAVGVVIGVIYRRNATSKDFLQASSEMHFFPVTLSIQASFLSAIFVVSLPAESYNFGIAYVYLGFSYFVAFPLIGKLFLPVFFRLKISSAYEYLELRFNRVVRIAASITFLLEMILYLGVAIYTPALIIEQVSPIPVWGCILLVSAVCLIYTVIGGMRATIWNDMIQMSVILIMLILLIGFGHANAGTIRDVYQIAKNGSRMELKVFVPNPTSRTTFWTQFVGGSFLHIAMYSASQTVIQKAMSTRSLQDAQRSMNALAGTYVTFLILVMWLGIVMYAYYAGCDPQLAGYVDKPDQLVPKFMMDILGSYHGLPGLFIAAIFSGALSTVSGGLNSMADVCYYDFFVPLYYHIKADQPPETLANILSRVFVVVWGVLVTIMAYASPYMGELILSVALSIFGMVGGPICGVVASGIFMPCVNPWGALVGLIVSLGIGLWLGIGTMIAGPPPPILPGSTDDCISDTLTPNASTTTHSLLADITTAVISPSDDDDDVFGFYKVSQMYYGLITMAICMIVAAIVSAISGVQKDVPYEQIFSCSDLCCGCFCCPTDARECFRCGSLPPDDENDDAVEVVEVHFKKTDDDCGVAGHGPGHPVRQLSYTLHADDVIVHTLPEEPVQKRERSGTYSLHTALFHNDSTDQNSANHNEEKHTNHLARANQKQVNISGQSPPANHSKSKVSSNSPLANYKEPKLGSADNSQSPVTIHHHLHNSGLSTEDHNVHNRRASRDSGSNSSTSSSLNESSVIQGRVDHGSILDRENFQESVPEHTAPSREGIGICTSEMPDNKDLSTKRTSRDMLRHSYSSISDYEYPIARSDRVSQPNDKVQDDSGNESGENKRLYAADSGEQIADINSADDVMIAASSDDMGACPVSVCSSLQASIIPEEVRSGSGIKNEGVTETERLSAADCLNERSDICHNGHDKNVPLVPGQSTVIMQGKDNVSFVPDFQDEAVVAGSDAKNKIVRSDNDLVTITTSL